MEWRGGGSGTHGEVDPKNVVSQKIFAPQLVIQKSNARLTKLEVVISDCHRTELAKREFLSRAMREASLFSVTVISVKCSKLLG